MYVVMAGQAHVRARPLTAGGEPIGPAPLAAGGQAAVPGRRVRATTDNAVAAPNKAGARRRTWQEGAFTHEEQQRLDGILAAIKQEGQQVGSQGSGYIMIEIAWCSQGGENQGLVRPHIALPAPPPPHTHTHRPTAPCRTARLQDDALLAHVQKAERAAAASGVHKDSMWYTGKAVGQAASEQLVSSFCAASEQLHGRQNTTHARTHHTDADGASWRAGVPTATITPPPSACSQVPVRCTQHGQRAGSQPGPDGRPVPQ